MSLQERLEAVVDKEALLDVAHAQAQVEAEVLRGQLASASEEREELLSEVGTLP